MAWLPLRCDCGAFVWRIEPADTLYDSAASRTVHACPPVLYDGPCPGHTGLRPCPADVRLYASGVVVTWPDADPHVCRRDGGDAVDGVAQLRHRLVPAPTRSAAARSTVRDPEPPGDPGFRLPPIRTAPPPDVETGRASRRTTRPV